MSLVRTLIGGRTRPRRSAVLRGAVKLAAVLVMLPIVLVPIYLVAPPVSTLMLWSAVTLQGMERHWVSIDEVAPVLVNSVVMSEDGRFCEHGGVDWQALNAVIDNPNGPSRGASTIPMQTVKNLFLWSARSYVRKAFEIPLATYADFVWPKRRTMEIYLNVAQWGPGLFGIEAAAQHYFKRPASRLTARQAALLATALPNPEVRDPSKPSRGHSRLARIVEGRARAAGAYVGCLADDAP